MYTLYNVPAVYPTKKKNMKHSLFGLLLALMVTACGTDPCGTDKDAFLNDYYKLLGEAKTANWPVSDDRWDTYDERFRAYVEECYDLHEPEMSGREKRRFWRKSLSYFTQRYGDGALNALKKDKSRLQKRLKEWGIETD
jgi:hypothetical protein